jgi:transposase-like protein
VADSEGEQHWGAVFGSLKDRGLRGVTLVVSDAHRGIRAAIDRHFQGVAWQRCRVHFKREPGRKVSYKRLKELNRDLAAVFAAAAAGGTVPSACGAARRWRRGGRRAAPRSRRCCGRVWRTAWRPSRSRPTTAGGGCGARTCWRT